MNAQVKQQTDRERLESLMASPENLTKLGQVTAGVQTAISGLLDSIRTHSEAIATAKNAADTRTGEQSGLWKDVAAIAKQVTQAVKAAGLEDWAGYVFSVAVAPVMPHDDDEGKRAATVKSYLSTGKNTVVRLLLPETVEPEKFDAMTYRDVRAALNPPKNPGANKTRDTIRKQVAYIARWGDTNGNDASNNASTRMDAIAAETLKHYNAVKTAKDAKSAAARAAKELEAGRQQAPSEAGTVETTTGKPEAEGRKAA